MALLSISISVLPSSSTSAASLLGPTLSSSTTTSTTASASASTSSSSSHVLFRPLHAVSFMPAISLARINPLTHSRQLRRRVCRVVSMAPEEEKMTRRSPLDFPIEWERPKPGRRPDIFPQFSPMKTPLPPPLPADPPEEDEEEEEEKKEEEEEDPEQENPDKAE